MKLPPGTVLCSRNRSEEENTSPGYWNHLAIVVSDGVVEAQQGIVEHGQGEGVIKTSIEDYMARDYSRIRAYLPLNVEHGQCAAMRAERLIGLPHAAAASLKPMQGAAAFRCGHNCVSVIKTAWIFADRLLRTLVKPDGMSRFVGRIAKKPVVIR